MNDTTQRSRSTTGQQEPNTTRNASHHTTSQTAQDVADEAQQRTKELANQAKAKAGEMTDAAKEQVTDAAREARDQAVHVAEEQKTRATDRLHSMAGALRESSHEFDQRQEETVAAYVNTAAQQVDQFADYLERNDVRDVWRGVQDLAQKQPELVIVGSLAAGFLLGRFLKSNGTHSRDQMRSAAYGRARSGNPSYGRPNYGMADDTGYSRSGRPGYGRTVRPGATTYVGEEAGYMGAGIYGVPAHDADNEEQRNRSAPGNVQQTPTRKPVREDDSITAAEKDA